MIISRTQVDRVLRAYLEGVPELRARSDAARGPAVPEDRVQISVDARRVSEYVELVRRLPDVRQERVAELRQAIRSGGYRVDPDAVAAKMLERLLADEAALEVRP